jgi:hypothetical protein
VETKIDVGWRGHKSKNYTVLIVTCVMLRISHDSHNSPEFARHHSKFEQDSGSSFNHRI